MVPRTIDKALLAGDPDQARAQLEELSGVLAAKDKAAGERLRAVAVELVRRGLQVAVVDYHDGWTELEATLPQAPHLGPVTVDRDAAGTSCQLAWDCWADITARNGAGQVADAAAALLRGLASCPSLTGPSALLAPREPDPASTPGQTRPGRNHDPRDRGSCPALPASGVGRSDRTRLRNWRADPILGGARISDSSSQAKQSPGPEAGQSPGSPFSVALSG